VTSRYPLPQYVLEYGDLAASAGQQELAEAQYALFHAEVRLFGSNGVDTNLETALFAADHGTDLEAGLVAARAEWRWRQSVTVADALAWALYADGRPREALTYARRALALGTLNASFFFHKGMIERDLGNRGAARADLAKALHINPNFSFLWAGKARAALQQLGGAS
jgi:tetratricopeptide (TPR) repeat protein